MTIVGVHGIYLDNLGSLCNFYLFDGIEHE